MNIFLRPTASIAASRRSQKKIHAVVREATKFRLHLISTYCQDLEFGEERKWKGFWARISPSFSSLFFRNNVCYRATRLQGKSQTVVSFFFAKKKTDIKEHHKKQVLKKKWLPIDLNTNACLKYNICRAFILRVLIGSNRLSMYSIFLCPLF